MTIIKLFVTALLLCCALTAQVKKFELIKNDIEITRTAHPLQYFDKIGTKSAVLGFESGQFELWIWPWKPLRNFELLFFTGNSTQPIAGKDIVRTISAAPEATTITYTYESFTVKEIFIVPVDEPGVIILLDVYTVEPLNIVPSFMPVMQPQWPAGVGGQYSYWNEDDKAFVISESQRRGIFLCGSPAGKEMSAPPAHMLSDNPLQFRIDVDQNKNADEYIPIVIAGGSNIKMDSVRNIYNSLWNNAEQLYKKNYEYYQTLRNTTTQIITPDQKFNLAYEWGKVSLRNLLVKNPDLGTGLVAGYGLSGAGGRPGFAWFFGGDAYINSLALDGFGDYTTVRDALKFTQKWQRQENYPIRKKTKEEENKDVGKMAHELSQSDGLVDWWNDYHFGYNHADTSPWYIVAMGDYVRKSGDVQFLKESWNSIKQAYRWCISKESNNDGLMDLKNAGLGVLEFGSLVKIYNDMYTQALWTQALNEMLFFSNFMKDDKTAKESKELLSKAKNSLEKLFWMEDMGFYSFGADENGTQVKEKNPYPSIAFDFKLLYRERTEKSLEAFAHSELSTNWGVRSLSNKSKFYDSRNYNYGAVWPFNSSMLGTAFYNYNFSLTGYTNLLATLQHQNNYCIGVIPEVFSGDVNQKLAEAYHNQGFSTTGFLLPFTKGLAGIEVDAVNNTLRFKPQIPADWDSLIVRNAAVGKNIIDLRYYKAKNSIDLYVSLKGTPGTKLEFAVVLPPGVYTDTAEVDGKRIQMHGREEEPLEHMMRKSYNAYIFYAEVQLTGENHIKVKYDSDPGIFYIPEKVLQGDRDESLKIISHSGEKIYLNYKLEGKAGKTYELGIRYPEFVKSVDGGRIEGNRIKIDFPGLPEQGFIEKDIRLTLDKVWLEIR